jgi:O-methyltransferase involved in polyketide biosynthesis
MNIPGKFDSISLTAAAPAFLRSGIDIPYADLIAHLIDARAKAAELIGGEHYLPALRDSYGAWAELRHHALSNAIREFHNVLELSAGFSPRGLIFTNVPGARYLATDLAQVSDSFIGISRHFMTERSRPGLRFGRADATDQMQVLACAAAFEGRGTIAVIHEGLLPYLTRVEQIQVARNIHALLSITGGSWYTTDIHTREETAQTLALGEAYMPSFQSKAGRRLENGGFDTLDEAEKLMTEAGLRVERREQLDLVVNLKSVAPNKAVTRMLKHQHLWTMTLR